MANTLHDNLSLATKTNNLDKQIRLFNKAGEIFKAVTCKNLYLSNEYRPLHYILSIPKNLLWHPKEMEFLIKEINKQCRVKLNSAIVNYFSDYCGQFPSEYQGTKYPLIKAESSKLEEYAIELFKCFKLSLPEVDYSAIAVTFNTAGLSELRRMRKAKAKLKEYDLTALEQEILKGGFDE